MLKRFAGLFNNVDKDQGQERTEGDDNSSLGIVGRAIAVLLASAITLVAIFTTLGLSVFLVVTGVRMMEDLQGWEPLLSWVITGAGVTILLIAIDLGRS